MPLSAPSSGAFKARYPEFDSVLNARVQAALDETVIDVTEAWITAHQIPAMLALAAHWLSQGGALESADIAAEAGGRSVVEHKAGDTAIKFAEPGRSETIEASGYARTVYGRRFLELRARSFPTAIMVV